MDGVPIPVFARCGGQIRWVLILQSITPKYAAVYECMDNRMDALRVCRRFGKAENPIDALVGLEPAISGFQVY